MFTTLPALVSLHAGHQAYGMPTDGAIPVGDWFGTMTRQRADNAALLAGRWMIGVFRFDDVPIFAKRFAGDVPAAEIKDVCHIRLRCDVRLGRVKPNVRS